MSEFDSLAISQENNSNSVDNDFEKLDALSTPEAEAAENLVSSTQDDEPPPESEEGILHETVANDDAPLVDLGYGSPSSSQPEPTPQLQESPRTPSPTPQFQLPPKKSATTSESTCWTQNIDPRVIDLVYWRDVKKSGIVFGSVLVLLLSLALFSVLSVVAYLSLAVLTVTSTFVVYKKILGAVQKQSDSHPFKQLLEYDVSLPEERLHEVADAVMKSSTNFLKELRRLFLVEDLVDSLKFGLILWVLTYFGAWFNGMTLIILFVVGVFTIPKFYETYKAQIDQYLDLAKGQINTVIAQIKEKIPIGKKKKEE